MTSLLRLLVTLMILSFSAEAVSLPETNKILMEKRFLESELRLAKRPDIYIILNFMEKRIQIKAKAIVLKEVPIEKAVLWGAPVQPNPLTLIKKNVFIKPGRSKIRPRKSDEDSKSQINAFEVEDMPVRYRLTFNDNIWLYVRPKPEGFFSALLNLLSSLKAFIIRPIAIISSSLTRDSFSEIDIYLNEKDAKFLYWASPESLQWIIYPAGYR